MSLGVTRLVMLVIPSASTAAMITTLEWSTVDNSRRPASDGYHNRKTASSCRRRDGGTAGSIRLRRQS
jgi:hypothetical protein